MFGRFLQIKTLTLGLLVCPLSAWAGTRLVAPDDISIPANSSYLKIYAEIVGGNPIDPLSGFKNSECVLTFDPAPYERTIQKEAVFDISNSNVSERALTVDEILRDISTNIDQGKLESLRERAGRGEISIENLYQALESELGIKFNQNFKFTRALSIVSAKSSSTFMMTCWSGQKMTFDELLIKLATDGKLRPAKNL
jgi:hypothetical protein